MDKNIVDLAVSIKETIKGSGAKLDNFIVGKIVSLSPMTISIDEAIMAYHDQIYALENTLPNFRQQVEYRTSGTSTGTLTFIDNLKVGDSVALVPSTSCQQYLMLGKVVSF